MKLKKVITLSATALMLASVGATSNVLPTSNVHASRVSRLVSQRNSDYRKSSYYNRQAKKLNAEIKHMTARHARKSRKSSRKITAKIYYRSEEGADHNHKPVRYGYATGMNNKQTRETIKALKPYYISSKPERKFVKYTKWFNKHYGIKGVNFSDERVYNRKSPKTSSVILKQDVNMKDTL